MFGLVPAGKETEFFEITSGEKKKKALGEVRQKKISFSSHPYNFISLLNFQI